MTLVISAILMSQAGLAGAEGGGSSSCTAPAGGRCTETFNLNEGEGLSGNFTSDEFVRLFVTDPSGGVVVDSAAS